MDPLNTKKTVGTDTTLILPQRTGLNSKRQAFVLTNTSTGGQKITIAVGKEAVDGEGIVLYPGGSWDRSPQESPPQEQIQAISDLAGGQLSVYEEVL